MKRDVSVVSLNEQECLVIAADNSGGIGLKEFDLVKTPYEVVAYYGFRVAVMECMAAGGKPISVVIHNFCQDSAWDAIKSGIQKGLGELGLDGVSITGSTESNFSLLQSALGLIVMGKSECSFQEQEVFLKQMRFAVVGSPLVGHEVLESGKDIIPLSLFHELCSLEDIVVLPIGSRGIRHELANMLEVDLAECHNLFCDVDMEKSAGPATCVLIAYKEELELALQQKCGHFFHQLSFDYGEIDS